jgi:predicted amidohydrolase
MEIFARQFDIAWENPGVNYELVSGLLESTTVAPDSLIVLPEMFATGFSMDAELTSRFQPETQEFLCSLARRYKSFVCGGLVMAGDDGLIHNCALLIAPTGEQITAFPKQHLFTLLGEDKSYSPGKSSVVCQVGEFCFSGLVCYDLRFPESFRQAVTKGAELFTVIANWPSVRAEHWVTLLRARAIENQAYVVGVNRCGQDPKCSYAGGTTVIDPHGKVLVAAGSDPQVISVDIDIESLREYRKTFAVLKDM